MSKKKHSTLNRCRQPKTAAFPIISVLGIVTVISFLAYFSFGIKSKAEPTLRHLSVIHRHGERNTKPKTYPFDPYTNESIWPEGKGELMKKGITTLFEAGKLLRQRYDGFIPPKYKKVEVLALSSPLDRCIMSGQALLAGLYPPFDDQIWNSEVNWQPIPVHPIPDSLDNFFTANKPCPKLKKEKEYISSTIWKKKLDENRELIDYAQKNAGVSGKSLPELVDLWDTLKITGERGLKLPDWASRVFLEGLTALTKYALTSWSLTPTIKRLYSGVLIDDVVTSMQMKRDSKETNKRLLNLYSGHDDTLLNFLINVGVSEELPIPEYGATAIIEFHEVNSKYRVKILYKNYGLDKDLTVLHVNGCEKDRDIHNDDMCDFDVFTSVIEPIRVTDFDKECLLND